MATHRSIPGANLPETGAASTRKNRGGASDAGLSSTSSSSGLGTPVQGESGLGSGIGTGLGAGSDAFGTTGSATADDFTSTVGSGAAGSATGAREYPRAAGVMDQVKQQASTRVNEQKARAAQGLGSVASAIRQASEHMRAENQTLAAYADKAVDQIQLFADRMRDKDPAEMVQDVERFARRNPAAFVGGAFFLGLGLARFLKSSSAHGERSRGDAWHRDTEFGDAGTTSVSGVGGFTAGGDFARADDLSRTSSLGSSTLGTADPAPGITS